MAINREGTYFNSAFQIDGEVYERCSFERCDLLYRGGTPPVFLGCTFGAGNRFRMTDAAERTVQYLKLLNATGMTALVDQLFKEICAYQIPTSPPKN